ncbi:MAG TPA: hypothetical protein VJQ56_11275 [Blastocatellia bacterium]|nr:hypothetical protein [Blastocatellia bacterium]
MKTNWKSDSSRVRATRNTIGFILMIAAIVTAAACGGGSHPNVSTSQFPGGTADAEQLERMLKFDARVNDYELSGDRLVVNVNQDFMTSPPGIKERAAGQWFNMLTSSRGKDRANSLQVVVRHEGEDVARWTADAGYEPLGKMKSMNASGSHAQN